MLVLLILIVVGAVALAAVGPRVARYIETICV